MKKNIKTALAKKNGLSKERYKEIVISGVKKILPNESDEIAILRKTLAIAISEIERITGRKLSIEEFREYNTSVEAIKIIAKEETN